MANFKSAILATATLILCQIMSVKAQVVDRPVVSGRQAVVTSDEPLASMAGIRMLQQGGNAFDAAVAAAIAVGVLDPRMGSIGGNGFATVYVAKYHQVRALNFYGSAPEHATSSVYRGKDYSHGAMSVPVPSSLKGFETLHRAYGRLPWAKVLEPSINLAENGFLIRKVMVDDMTEYERILTEPPSMAKVFRPNGHLPRAGESARSFVWQSPIATGM